MNDPTRVLIFTGAGAGVPLGLPTSTGFAAEVTADAAMVTQCAIGFLQGTSAKDIEWILATLEAFQGERSFIETLLPRFISGPPATAGALAQMKSGLAQYRSDARSEIKRIKKILFDKLGRYDHKKAAVLYRGLLGELKVRYPSFALSMITTNYDLTFENTLEEEGEDAWKEFGISDVDFGFSIRFGKSIYDPKSDFAWKPEIMEFLKIHGSLDWHRDEMRQCVRSGSRTVPDNPDQMAILYPGFKGVPEEKPFSSLHVRLGTRLTQADVVFVLGFAFRDAYINSIFENVVRTRTDLPVYYFNPLPLHEHPKGESLVPRLAEFPNFKHIEKPVEATDTPLGLASLF